jgi:hypothetical protein
MKVLLAQWLDRPCDLPPFLAVVRTPPAIEKQTVLIVLVRDSTSKEHAQ